MNAQRHRWFIRTGTILLGFVLISAASPADDAGGAPASGNASPTLQPIDFQVLQTTKIDLGNRSVIFNLVAPPLLPVPSVPVPSPIPPSADQPSAMQQGPPPKPTVMFCMMATVYDHQVARLNWFDENGPHTAFSNLDFNYFSGVACVETADTSYFLILSVVNSTLEAAATNNVQIPDGSQFSAGSSQYLLTPDGSASPTDQSVKALNDLHAYFDSNRQPMIDSYNKRVADEAARAKWLLEHPPVPQDTIINLWPVNSTNYPTAPQGGQK